MKYENEIWKTIEEATKYEVSNYGRIRNKDTKFIRKPFISNRGYLRVGLHPNKSIHVLVYKAFGNKDKVNLLRNRQMEVNHIDGNKFNNHMDNLEAITASENIKHAFKNGLRKDNFRCVLENIEDGTKKNFISLNELGKHLNINNDTLIAYIPRSYKYPILGKYIINARLHTTGNDDRHVYVYDHVTDEVNEYNNLYHTSFATGIVHISFSKDLKKNSIKYLGGYTFSYNPINANNVNHISKEQAFKDREAIWSKPIKNIHTGIKVYDPELDSITEYEYVTELAKKLNAKPRTVNAVIEVADKKFNRAGLFKGLVITRINDNYPLKDVYTKRKIYLSKHGAYLTSKLFKMDDKYVIGTKLLAMKLGTTESTIVNLLNTKKLEEKFDVEIID